jgi:hypothetical protein
VPLVALSTRALPHLSSMMPEDTAAAIGYLEQATCTP